MISADKLDDFVRTYDPSFRDVGTVFLNQVEKAITAESVLVDVGCGRTSYGAAVYKKAKKRIGLDVDEYAKENPIMDEVHIMTGEMFPLPDACADVVTAQWVVEHVAHPDTFLKEVSRVLRPGGTFIFMTTNIKSPIIRLTSFIPLSVASFIRTRLLNFAHDETFPRIYAMNSSDKLKKLAEAHGFEMTVADHIESFGYFRFSSIILQVYIWWTKLLRKVTHNREMHIVGVFRKK
ncbi:MAG: class I SAM-dependent methyltransferase [Patescibacteria group bacterium]